MESDDKKDLFGNWEETKKALISGLKPKTSVMKTLLENQERFIKEMAEEKPVKLVPLTEEEEAEEIIRRLKAPPKPKITYRSVILPMIRRIIPGTIAQEITSVQPMTGPISTIHTLRHRYGKQEETPDDEGRGS